MEDNICSICGKPNEPWPHKPGTVPGGYGNNAEPVNSGRCCSSCNHTVVIPTRLRASMRAARARQVTDGQHRNN